MSDFDRRHRWTFRYEGADYIGTCRVCGLRVVRSAYDQVLRSVYEGGIRDLVMADMF